MTPPTPKEPEVRAMASDAMVRCPSCEKYVWANAAHSCYNAKQVRVVRDAEAAVVAAAEEVVHWNEQTARAIARNMTDAIAKATESGMQAHRALDHAVRALHAARQGGA